ncbi:protein phosphatase 2C domain-containing protein [Sphingomonas aracearum]|uniref:Protein phosphatase 2C domain-containing protein n=1 Tax=Sphingomonas aracearum TaxID=2283317 RepID=A0A369VQJ2_9SPHN|nr:protein phosphatase 2C domain-containing protein [Sphingomonas aracearum]RDE04654.1 hypothetical protein DVW87_13755 [Sphingomonas aracearum]
MHLDLLQSLSLCGRNDTPNDDRAGNTARTAWVIDGATDLGPPGLLGDQGGAAWLAATADAGFGLADAPELAGTCDQVFAHVAARYAAERRRAPEAAWELPSAAFAAVQLVGNKLHVAWAADCAVLHRSSAGVRWCTPAPDRAAESAAAAALGEGVGALPRTGAVLDDRRAARARPGRQVLGIDPSAARAAMRLAAVEVAPGDGLLLMTDGFSALIDAYGVHDAAALFAAAERQGLAALGQQLRDIEEQDADCRRFPRFKRSDDATALWLRIGGAA